MPLIDAHSSCGIHKVVLSSWVYIMHTSHSGGGVVEFSYCRKHCGLYSCLEDPVKTSCPVMAIAPPRLLKCKQTAHSKLREITGDLILLATSLTLQYC